MKKLINLSIALSFIISLFSCSVDDVIDDIAIPVPFAVPVSLTSDVPLLVANTDSYVKYPEIPLNLDLNAKIKEQFPSFSINNLKSVKLESLSIQMLSSSNDTDLSVIKNANIYIKTPNLTEKLIATAVNNTNGSVITFTPVSTNPELLEYLKTNQNSLIMEIQGSKLAAATMKLKLDASFKLEVGL